MSDEKVWRGWAKNAPCLGFVFGNSVEVVVVAATVYDAMKERLGDIEQLRNYQPETPIDERSWIPYLLDAKARILALEAALATAEADALELAKEVRRCHALAQDADDRICEGDVAGFALFGDACHEMIDDRPAAVTAAMERYA